MSPELVWISNLSASDSESVFSQLMHHFTEDSLRRCYTQLPGRAAVGSDGISVILMHRLRRDSHEPNALIGHVGFYQGLSQVTGSSTYCAPRGVK